MRLGYMCLEGHLLQDVAIMHREEQLLTMQQNMTVVAETLLHNFYVDDCQIRRNSYSANQRCWKNVEKMGLI